MWPDGGQSPGELRRFFVTGEDLGVCWSADNSGRTAGIRDVTEDIDEDEDENCASGPAGPPSASVNPRPHTFGRALFQSVAPAPGVWNTLLVSSL
jgi:hypothetical protein